MTDKADKFPATERAKKTAAAFVTIVHELEKLSPEDRRRVFECVKLLLGPGA